MRSFETLMIHRPASASLKGRGLEEVGYIETPDEREQTDVLLELAQEWYRERPQLFEGEAFRTS